MLCACRCQHRMGDDVSTDEKCTNYDFLSPTGSQVFKGLTHQLRSYGMGPGGLDSAVSSKR